MISQFLPQLFPRHWEDEYGLFGLRFTTDVSLGFVSRGRSEYRYLPRSDYSRLSIDTDEIVRASLNNLAALSESRIQIARPMGGTILWIVPNDNFVAVRMLLPAVQQMIQKEVGTSFLFTISCRDEFLVWNKDAPVELTEKNAAEALRAFRSDSYCLSPHVFEYREPWPCEPFEINSNDSYRNSGRTA